MARLTDNRNSEPVDFRRPQLDMKFDSMPENLRGRPFEMKTEKDLVLDDLLASFQRQMEATLTQVDITCQAPSAKAVFVAGTFNHWSASATPMARGLNGAWTATIKIAPGRYEFKFVVDGRWCCDPALNDDAVRQKPPGDWVPNGMGSFNRVMQVGTATGVGGRP